MYSPPRLALQPDTPGTQSSLQCRWDEGKPDVMGRRPGGCENEDQLEQKRGLTTQIASMVRETRGVSMVTLIFREEALRRAHFARTPSQWKPWPRRMAGQTNVLTQQSERAGGSS